MTSSDLINDPRDDQSNSTSNVSPTDPHKAPSDATSGALTHILITSPIRDTIFNQISDPYALIQGSPMSDPGMISRKLSTREKSDPKQSYSRGNVCY